MDELAKWVKLQFQSGIPPTIRIQHKHSDTGVAWAGFWIGLGIVIAAAVMKGQVVIR